MESGGGVAKLTLTQLAKDDEGLYTLRMVTKGGDAVHRAYVYVDGKKVVNFFEAWCICVVFLMAFKGQY